MSTQLGTVGCTILSWRDAILRWRKNTSAEMRRAKFCEHSGCVGLLGLRHCASHQTIIPSPCPLAGQPQGAWTKQGQRSPLAFPWARSLLFREPPRQVSRALPDLAQHLQSSRCPQTPFHALRPFQARLELQRLRREHAMHYWLMLLPRPRHPRHCGLEASGCPADT